MKNNICIVLCILSSIFSLSAQKKINYIFFCGYENNFNASKLCENLEMGIDKDAENAVIKILNPLGLPHNFILVPCANIKNAVAVTAKDGLRYIVYDKIFMQNINLVTTDWSSVSILAHEIGHHLCGHTLNVATSLLDQRQKELEADEFSGFILSKMGATSEQTFAAIKLLGDEEDDTFSTHPNKTKRIESIKKGYDKAKNQQININILSKKEISESEENLFTESYILFEIKGDKQGAILILDKIIQTNPNSYKAFFNRGYMKLRCENYIGTLSDINQALNLYPELKRSHRVRGDAKFELGDNRGAIQDFTEAINNNNDNLGDLDKIYSNRGLAKKRLGDFEGCLNDYSFALKINPKSDDVYFKRASVKKDLNDIRGAIVDCNEALQINPNNLGALDCRAVIKYKLEDYRGAINDLDKVISLDTNPESLAHSYYSRGKLKMLLRNRSGGCNDFKKSCELGKSEACSYYRSECR